MKRVNVAILIICTLIIALFIYTAVAKLLDYSNFRFGLSESPLIASFAGPLSWLIPGSELGIAIMLMVPAWRLAGLYASFVLLFLFTVYIAAMLMTGVEMPCSCGGVIEDLSWGAHVAFNSAFVLLSALGIWLMKMKRRSIAFQTVIIQ
jgi:hypothetical protein